MITATKERPILFSGEMVRAILDGRKTQTRRVVKHIPMLGDPLAWCAAAAAQEPGWVSIVGDYRRFCPYGSAGDRLWVRETWALYGQFQNGPGYCYRADGDLAGVQWKPSIHMRRSASRIALEITGVRVERLHQISREDALAEGVTKVREHCYVVRGSAQDKAGLGHSCPITAFDILWNDINEKRGYGSAVNPWVWVIEFKRIKP